MKLRIWCYDLNLTNRWTIARSLKPGGAGGMDKYPVAFVELTDKNGAVGVGEAAPSERYDETVESVVKFFERINPYNLSFSDLEGSMRHIAVVGPGAFCAKGALNIALLDGASRLAGKPLHEFLGLSFTEGRHTTSFSIGIASPADIRQKVAEAAPFPILKLKLGGGDDRACLKALREVAPDKWIRVDANEAWKSREEALGHLEWLAADGKVQFVEQPMPASTPLADQVWLKARTPLPLMADESYVFQGDAGQCAEGFHAVNVKLVKTGGVTAGLLALRAARSAGLKTMLGCMIESSILISAAAHLADLTDFLDLDGNLLIKNDPYRGVVSENGRLSFAKAPAQIGLQTVVR